MSTSDDPNRDAPPTLFGPQQAAEGGADVRILAGLEGRVPAGADARPTGWAARQGRRHGVFVLVAALLVIAGGVTAWWSQQGDEVLAGNAAPAQPAAAPVVEIVQPPAETAVSNVAPDTTAGASVIDVSPADVMQSAKRDEVALDQLGRTPESATAAAVASLAGVGAAHAATHRRTGEAGKSAVAATGNAANAKNDATVGTSQAKDGNAKSLAKVSASERKKASRKKATASRAEDDPDAEVIAALMGPPSSSTIATKGRTKASARTQ